MTGGRIHLVSTGRDGGVFQHTVAVGQALRRAGYRVTVHIADRSEEVDLDGLEVCRCVVWTTRIRRPHLRRASIALRYLTTSNMHLLRAVGRSDILHFEGLFRPVLSASTIMLQRLAGRVVVHSPHNTFSRSGGRVDDFLIRLMARAAHASIVFSAHDGEAVSKFGGRPVRCPLLLLVPRVDPAVQRRWRMRWSPSPECKVILFAGQIRRDKRLDLVIRSAAQWPDRWRLAVVGSDAGAWEASNRLAQQLGVPLAATVGFCSLDEFAGAIGAADVVVCPYERASQSAILAMAKRLGTPTVATDVGGLDRYADRVLAEPAPELITDAIASLLESSTPVGDAADEEAATVAAHRRAYEIARRAHHSGWGPIRRFLRAVRLHAVGLALTIVLRPRSGHELVHIGSDDAGWWVPPVGPETLAYCAGAGEDINFDLGLLRRGCRVTTFDPTPRAIAHVEGSSAMDCDRFTFVPVGWWSEATELRFYAPRDPSHVSHSAVNLQGTAEFFTAPVKPVYQLMDELGDERVDLIKMDIEGAEYGVIDSLVEHGPLPRALCIEFDQPQPIRRTVAAVRKLERAGYMLARMDSFNYTFLRA